MTRTTRRRRRTTRRRRRLPTCSQLRPTQPISTIPSVVQPQSRRRWPRWMRRHLCGGTYAVGYGPNPGYTGPGAMGYTFNEDFNYGRTQGN
jgi:hypothetical protein